jgi:branched-chain amino acid aminotransferase
MSLIDLAKEMGMKTERRQVPVSELPEFEEAGACGTAAVISPIAKIFDPQENRIYEYCKDSNPGPNTLKLYNRLIDLQYGDGADTFNWMTVVE